MTATPNISVTAEDEETAWDHGLTIGNLPSASKAVTSVAPDADLSKAIALMLLDDYSQLAVMTGVRDLKGAVSLKSIAKARNANPEASLSAAMFKADAVPCNADLISTLPLIQRNAVRGNAACARGIVDTATGVAGCNRRGANEWHRPPGCLWQQPEG